MAFATALLLLLAACSGVDLVAGIDFEGELKTLCDSSELQVVGCRLYQLCSGDHGYCQPATLLATACEELSDTEPCKRVDAECSDSGTGGCADYEPVPDSPSTLELYADAQNICSDGTLDGCTECSEADDGTNLDAVLAKCPDPLGLVAYQCLGQDMVPCKRWSALCDTLGGDHFPTLCTTADPASLLAVTAAAPSKAPPSSSNRGSSEAMAGTEPCLEDPTKAQCADYRYPAANATEDNRLLCEAMPNMVGCTLQSTCEATGVSTGYCSPFSLLGDLCKDMPAMGGCRKYMQLCGSSTSVVKQCTQEGPLPGVMSTDATTKAVLRMCKSHAMAGCETCTDEYVNCPDPMGTMSKLCWEMAGMSDCQPFYSMCSGQAQQDLPELCGNSTNSQSIPPMTMWYHQRVEEVILWKEWVPRSTAAYIASWFAIFVMAVAVQALKAMRTVVEYQWVRKQRESLLCHCGEPEPELPKLHGVERYMTRDQAFRNLVRTLFTGLMVVLEYWLMLVVMLFNVGLFVAVVTGYMVGAMLFGHVGEAAYNYQLPAGAKDGPGATLAISSAMVETPPPDLTKNGCCSSECV